jgi:hypothetical protein
MSKPLLLEFTRETVRVCQAEQSPADVALPAHRGVARNWLAFARAS